MDAFSQLAEQGGEVLILVVLPLTIFCLAVFYLLGFSRQEMELRIKGTCFGAFGLVVGLLMGASREPVVSNTLPLLISIITVLITYLYETKADPKPAKEYLLSARILLWHGVWQLLWCGPPGTRSSS